MDIINVGKQPLEIDFKQSANTLFNFMSRFEYLEKALTSKRMYPRYFEENIEYLNFTLENEKITRVAYPMLCFCDIKLHTLSEHMDGANSDHGYGHFGIGLDKTWYIKKGIQPIDYINDNSPEAKMLSKALNEETNLLSSDMYEDEISYFFDYLLAK